jgi:hypothetical protein
VVRPARAVGPRVGGHVVDRAVDGEVDWFGRVGAVVGGEFGRGEVDWGALGVTEGLAGVEEGGR